ncbi:hypothetical protein CPAR01_09784, partial [Colletotrichum paranaense]
QRCSGPFPDSRAAHLVQLLCKTVGQPGKREQKPPIGKVKPRTRPHTGNGCRIGSSRSSRGAHSIRCVHCELRFPPSQACGPPHWLLQIEPVNILDVTSAVKQKPLGCFWLGDVVEAWGRSLSHTK